MCPSLSKTTAPVLRLANNLAEHSLDSWLAVAGKQESDPSSNLLFQRVVGLLFTTNVTQRNERLLCFVLVVEICTDLSSPQWLNMAAGQHAPLSQGDQLACGRERARDILSQIWRIWSV